MDLNTVVGRIEILDNDAVFVFEVDKTFQTRGQLLFQKLNNVTDLKEHFNSQENE